MIMLCVHVVSALYPCPDDILHIIVGQFMVIDEYRY